MVVKVKTDDTPSLTQVNPPIVTFDETPLVVFIPKNDDSFATTSHRARVIIETPDGDWLFKSRIEEKDEVFDSSGQPVSYGRCDTCGEFCDAIGCTANREHAVALA